MEVTLLTSFPEVHQLIRRAAKYKKCTSGHDVQQLKCENADLPHLVRNILSDVDDCRSTMRLGMGNGQDRIDRPFDRQQFIDIGFIDVIARDSGKWCAKQTMAVENEATQTLLQALEVKKDQRIISVDHHPAVVKTDLVIADIPGREICSDIFDHFHSRRPP